MKCSLCNNTEFFELSDGRSYCTVCQTRNDVIQQDTDFWGSLGKKVIVKRKTKLQELYKNWTTLECFNIILIEQTNKISEICNLDDNFKKLVLSIWISFLKENESGFKDNVDIRDLPKIQQFVTKRDFDFIVNNKVNLESTTKTKKKVYKSNKFKLHNKVILIKDMHSNENLESHQELDQNLNELDEFSELSEKTKKDSSLEDKKRKRFSFENSDYALYNEDLDEVEKSEEILKNEIQELEILINLIKGKDEKKVKYEQLIKKKKYLCSSSYAKKVLKNNLKHRTSTSLKQNANLMTCHKTISIIYLALRILNVDVYLFDLIRWINEGHIPFFFTFHLLPQELKMISTDFNTFVNMYSPNTDTINNNLRNIANLIGIKKLPIPNLEKLLKRICYDLNLPNEFKDLICAIYRKHILEDKKSCKFLLKNFEEGFSISDYESIVFGLILITLRRIFLLNDYYERHLNDIIKKSNDFIEPFLWSEWEAHTKFKLECIQRFYFPTMEQNVEDLENFQLLQIYYEKLFHQNKHDFFLTSNNFVFKKKQTCELLEESYEKLFNEYKPKLNQEQLEPNFLPLISMTRYILSNYETRNDNLLEVDFREKKINFLFQDLDVTIPEDIPMKKIKTCLSKADDLSRIFKYLIKTFSLIMNKREEIFMKRLFSIEKRVFKNYFI